MMKGTVAKKDTAAAALAARYAATAAMGPRPKCRRPLPLKIEVANDHVDNMRLAKVRVRVLATIVVSGACL